MQIEDLGVVEETSSEIPSLGSGIETSLQSSDAQEVNEPKDVNQYLEYMRQKREALEKAAVLEPTPLEKESLVPETAEKKTIEDAKEKNKEGEKMKNKKEDMLDLNVSSQEGASIEDIVAQAMQQDEILLYQQKYLDSLESRKNKVETIISMLQKEKESIDAQIQAVK